MSLEIFWLAGLLIIGVITFILCKTVTVTTTKDSETVRSVLVWSGILITLRVVFGGLLVTLAILEKGKMG